MNKSVLSFIGFAATIAGAGLTMVSSRVDSKLMDIKIEEAVAKAIAKQLENRG